MADSLALAQADEEMVVGRISATPLAQNAPSWLDLKHPIFEQNADFWERQERLFIGGANMRGDELLLWETEDAASNHYQLRLNMAAYSSLPKKHAQMMTGHLRRKAPAPDKGYDFGSLGKVRPRSEYQPANASLAELLYYNADGIGNDGSQLPVFTDTVSDFAQATGYRWVMVEVPAYHPSVSGATPSQTDVANGLHPYLCHLSPLNVPLWWDVEGRLEFAVVRTRVDAPDFQSDYIPSPDLLGYYLLVRKGCTLLGAEYEGGGWWLWDSKKDFIDAAPWSHVTGEIPLFTAISIPSQGTIEHPNIGASQTEELGQIAVAMMNLISARDSDAIDAAKSKIYFLGADDKTMNVVVATSQGQMVAVPAVPRQMGGADGTVSYQVPSIYDGSMGAVAADVFTTILDSKWEEAKQLMLDTVTSTPDSSGRSKEAGFAEAASPLLARMATTREEFENMILYFYALRAGVKPDATVEWPKEFDLAPVVEDIDAMFDTLRRASQATQSPTLVKAMTMQALDDRQINLSPEDRAKVIAELDAKAAADQAMKDATQQATINAMTGKNPDGTPADPASGGAKPGGATVPPPKPLVLPPAANPDDAGTSG